MKTDISTEEVHDESEKTKDGVLNEYIKSENDILLINRVKNKVTKMNVPDHGLPHFRRGRVFHRFILICIKTSNNNKEKNSLK